MTAREQQDRLDEMKADAAPDARPEPEEHVCTICDREVRGGFTFRQHLGHLGCVVILALEALQSETISVREFGDAIELLHVFVRDRWSALEERDRKASQNREQAARERHERIARDVREIAEIGSGS